MWLTVAIGLPGRVGLPNNLNQGRQPMTKSMMNLRALVEKDAEANLPREMIGLEDIQRSAFSCCAPANIVRGSHP